MVRTIRCCKGYITGAQGGFSFVWSQDCCDLRCGRLDDTCLLHMFLPENKDLLLSLLLSLLLN